MSSKDFTVLLIRLALGLIYLTAGFSKLAPHLIGNLIGPVDPKMLFDSEFFRVFMLFVAVYQIIAGALLLSQRYSVYGLILLFPIALGIMIFTFVVPFALTPYLNLIFLSMLIFAIFQEKESVLTILKGNFKSFKNSAAYHYFPDKKLVHIALTLIVLAACLSFLTHYFLNILCSAAILIFTINLFQVKNFLLMDKIIIGIFFLIGFITINGMLLNKIYPTAFISAYLLIAVGFLFYIIRLICAKFFNKTINKL